MLGGYGCGCPVRAGTRWMSLGRSQKNIWAGTQLADKEVYRYNLVNTPLDRRQLHRGLFSVDRVIVRLVPNTVCANQGGVPRLASGHMPDRLTAGGDARFRSGARLGIRQQPAVPAETLTKMQSRLRRSQV